MKKRFLRRIRRIALTLLCVFTAACCGALASCKGEQPSTLAPSGGEVGGNTNGENNNGNNGGGSQGGGVWTPPERVD